MKNVRRIALLFAGGTLAFFAVALLAVNLYVQSRGTQARIEQELSQRLGAVLRIRRISVTPWWGLKLTGITMPQAEGAMPGDFLQADTFRLRVRFRSLFSRRLVINEISLINPKVIWAQDADGKWRLPASFQEEVESATVDAPPPTAPGQVAPAAAPSAQRQPGTIVPAPAETGSATVFTPEVRRVNLTNGKFRFLDEKRKPVATFEGVRFRSNFRTATELQGTATIAKVSLRDRFFLEELKSPLTYDPAALDFSGITARAAGGEISGRFQMRPGDAGSPFEVMVKFRDLEADRIVSDARGPRGMVQGKLEGHLDAAGRTADPNALSGAGEIRLRDGQVRRYSLLVALAQLLQIEELEQLQLDDAHVKYHIAPGVVTIDELLLTSANIRLSATGTISFTGRLQLESQLAINERIQGQLFSAIRENFQPIDVPGYAGVAFQVSGTVERPKTNLMDKVIGQELKDLGGVIDSLLGRGKRDRPKRKKAEELAPPPTPEDAAAPAAPPVPVEAPAPDPSP